MRLNPVSKNDGCSTGTAAGANKRYPGSRSRTLPNLQGNVLALRDAERTKRFTLTPEKQLAFICGSMNIHRDIVIQALEVIRHGRAAASLTR